MSDTVTRNHDKLADDDIRERHFDSLPDLETAVALFDALNERRAPPKAPVLSTPLVLYGLGEEGSSARNVLAVSGVPVALAFDHERGRLGGNWNGIATADPGAIEEDFKSEALVAVTQTDRPFGPIARRLAEEGWRNVVPFLDLAESCRDRHAVSGGWTSRWLNKKDFARAAAVMERWADDRSRAHHLALAAWRLRRSEWDFAGAPVTPEDRFLPVEIIHAMTPDERLLDIGAFHGAGLLSFASRPGRQFGHIWAVEPDATNRAILDGTLISHGRALASKVTVLSHVIGATAGPMPFRDGLGPWSQVGEAGGEERSVVTVDELDLAPTFIVIDVPGANEVLEGALETLERGRPIIAVEAGHNPDGLWKIADHLMTTLEGYRFLMRGHGWCGVRCVVYAIPQERAAD